LRIITTKQWTLNGQKTEIPVNYTGNVVLGEDFAEIFDGFSIGFNDLMQLTLGLDRDSEMVSDL